MSPGNKGVFQFVKEVVFGEFWLFAARWKDYFRAITLAQCNFQDWYMESRQRNKYFIYNI